MTQLLEKAIAKVTDLAPADQDAIVEAAERLLRLVEEAASEEDSD